MFGRSKPVVLESSYGRKRRRPPRWLVLLLLGIATGAAAVVLVQERYLPPRLSAAESAQLRQQYASTEAERARLAQALADTQRKLADTQASAKKLDEDLSASRSTVQALRDDLSVMVEALPPDPRGGRVEVRAGRFTARGGNLVYDLVLTRDRAAGKTMNAVLQLSVTGTPARGAETSVALKPVSLALGSHEVLRGSVALPEGFKPRETMVQVLDRPAGRSLGMRVMLVK